MNLPNPKTNTQEVLLTLIQDGSVSLFNFPTLSGFRTRVSELVNYYKIPLTTELKEGTNKFGNKYKYALHNLHPENLTKAIDVYIKISNER